MSQSVICAKKGCNVYVAPYSNDRIQVGLEVFHRNCHRKLQQEEQEKLQQQMNCRVTIRLRPIVQ